jgi:hypothetical protein
MFMALKTISEPTVTFIHIPKTAGTSVRSWFFNNFGQQGIQSLGKQHSTLSDIKHLGNLGKTFAIVRNPWDRVVSAWVHDVSMYHSFRNNENKYDIKRKKVISKEQYEKGFEDYIQNSRLLQQSQLDYCRDCDIILKYETLNKDFKIIQDMLSTINELPFKNVHKRKHYSTFYNSKTITLVYEKFKEEIDFFNYGFESL